MDDDLEDPLLAHDLEDGQPKDAGTAQTIWARMTFNNIKPIMDKGVRKQLDFEELLDLPYDMDPSSCHKTLQSSWRSQLIDNCNNPSFFKAICSAYGWPYFRIGVLKKQGEQLVNINHVAGVRKAVVHKKAPEKKKSEVPEKKKTEVLEKKKTEVVANPEKTPCVHEKVEQKQSSRQKKSASLTSFLTARSKEACGLARKPEELVMNIDEGSKEDELAVVEYVEDIYNFYKLAENESRIHDYIGKQPDVNEKMRSILVDWLIEVHYKFELRQESLYLTVNIIDRFLSMKVVPRKELQLVGIAAMLIACKYEEIWAPEVNDFVQISDNAYVREQVLAMEKVILGKLEWYLTIPTPYMFLARYVKASIPADSEMEKMVYFFAELGIMNYSTTIKYPPSLLAASSVYAARSTLNSNPSWTSTLKHYTGYTEDQLKECARLLVSFHSTAPDNRLKAIYKKYSKPEAGSVALRPPAKGLLSSVA